MKNRNEKKFTLIELLVVIGIIALLAALLFPAIGAVRTHAKKVKAQAVITSLKTAITQYEAQYGLLPFAYGADIEDGNYLTNDTYDDLIELLTCVDVDQDSVYVYNLRKTRFLTGLPATASSASEQTLTDPFKLSGQKHGKRLVLAVDLDGDNQVTVDGNTLNGKIFIWSVGADGVDQFGLKTGSGDDIPSWE